MQGFPRPLVRPIFVVLAFVILPFAARAADDAPPLVASNGRPPQHAAAARDPEAVRASFSNHFGGVRSGRSQARHVKQGPDQE